MASYILRALVAFLVAVLVVLGINWARAAGAQTTQDGGTQLAASRPAEHAIAGELIAVDPVGMTITIQTMKTVETVRFTEDTAVHQPKGTVRVPDLVGRTGAQMVVRYRGEGAARVALVLDDTGEGPLQVTEGIISWVDMERGMVVVKPVGQKEEPFWLVEGATIETNKGVVSVSECTAKEGQAITLYYKQQPEGRRFVYLMRYQTRQLTD